MKTKEYNLLHEKWIMATDCSDNAKKLSLLEVFEQAHLLGDLRGELATQDIAMLRLLLAVLHSVFSRWSVQGQYEELDDSDHAIERWKEIWEMGRFPFEVIEKYLLSYEERFYLFHDVRPFMQVRFDEPIFSKDNLQMTPAVQSIKAFAGDVAESDNADGNWKNLFLGRERPVSMEYDEAARWMVHLNGFGLSPAGAPRKGYRKIKGYKLAWLANLGLVSAQGRNLFETLMLNLVLGDMGKGDFYADGAEWEDDTVIDARTLEDITPAFPRCSARLLSMRFRFIELVRSESGPLVEKVLVWSGRTFPLENRFLEHMTKWKKKGADYVPQEHAEKEGPPKQIWRGFASLLASSEEGGEFRPGVVIWIENLESEGCLDIPFIRLRTVGQKTKNNSAIEDVFEDSLSFSSQLLSDAGQSAWITRIQSEVSRVDDLAKEAGFLAQNIAKAAGGGDGAHKKEAAMEQLYSRVDAHFRRWLESINPAEDDIDESCEAWRDRAKQITRSLGNELVAQAGPQAMIGRELEEEEGKKKVKRWYAAPKAYNDFIFKISNI
jgi:CRISPR system Cascade subunit CasA